MTKNPFGGDEDEARVIDVLRNSTDVTLDDVDEFQDSLDGMPPAHRTGLLGLMAWGLPVKGDSAESLAQKLKLLEAMAAVFHEKAAGR